jgi:hypothetical protein
MMIAVMAAVEQRPVVEALACIPAMLWPERLDATV